MGGGPAMPYPKWVWTPAGGWYCNPPNWKRNTGLALAGYAFISYAVFKLSTSLERRPSPPYNFIPSQSWCKYAATDDPRVRRGLVAALRVGLGARQ